MDVFAKVGNNSRRYLVEKKPPAKGILSKQCDGNDSAKSQVVELKSQLELLDKATDYINEAAKKIKEHKKADISSLLESVAFGISGFS